VGLESSLQLLHNEAEVVLRIMLTDSVRIEQHILRILASERRGSGRKPHMLSGEDPFRVIGG